MAENFTLDTLRAIGASLRHIRNKDYTLLICGLHLN